MISKKKDWPNGYEYYSIEESNPSQDTWLEEETLQPVVYSNWAYMTNEKLSGNEKKSIFPT